MRFLSLLNFSSLLLISLIFSPCTVKAETIELKNGQTIEASIIRFSDQDIEIKAGETSQLIPNEEISKINGKSFAAELTVYGSSLPAKPKTRKEKIDATLKDFQKNVSDFSASWPDKFKNTMEEKFPNQQEFLKNEIATLPAWGITASISIVLIMYLYLSLPYFIMAGKLDLGAGWQILTLIPFLQILAFVKISGKPLWWTVLLFVPFINLIAFTIMYCFIAKRCGKDALLGVLILIPVINFFLTWYLAITMKKVEKTGPVIAPGAAMPSKKRYAITPFEDENPKT